MSFARRSSMRSVVVTATVIAVSPVAVLLSAAQAPSTPTSSNKGPRTPNGKPDLNGVLQTFSTARSDPGLRMH
jgi:hypothetical protein